MPFTVVTTGAGWAGALTGATGTSSATGPLTASATFTAPEQSTFTVYHFRLTATAQAGTRTATTDTDIVSVRVNDDDPVTITALPDILRDDDAPNEMVTVGLTNPDGDNLVYAWAQTAKSDTAAPDLVLSGQTTATLTIDYPALTTRMRFTYTVQVTVTDSVGNAAQESFQIDLRDNTAPTASAIVSPAATVETDADVTLVASASRQAGGGGDDSGTGLTFLWQEVDGANSNTLQSPASVTLNSADAVEADFTAPNAPATLHFRVNVQDTVTGGRDFAWVTVTVIWPRLPTPTVNAAPISPPMTARPSPCRASSPAPTPTPAARSPTPGCKWSAIRPPAAVVAMTRPTPSAQSPTPPARRTPPPAQRSANRTPPSPRPTKSPARFTTSRLTGDATQAQRTASTAARSSSPVTINDATRR